ncbi:hypothetical protein BDY19DRAFT_932230 [Irpex rosettiformis]|uniref:Uncharacterized protein n=1 Tax=Irpex rosettiformis TaxID=378272 RepID=A0ACB8UBY8_9APHY|nr:hypothetical protein BDY19DRAFT_932230 [Irpex rosettiformis]
MFWTNDAPSYKHPALEVKQTPFSGRTYHSNCALTPGSCILDIATPYADTIYKHFRTEVCAECWRYDGGRRTFLTMRDLGENAGLFFCNDQCKASWLGREGEELVELLSGLETARRRKQQGKDKQTDAQAILKLEDIEQYIVGAWDVARRDTMRVKLVRQWKTLQLDDFEADIARYVLIALYHYARELDSQGLDAPGSCCSSSHVRFGMASWDDFSALQSGEQQQISKFPELVNDHVHIYQVLHSRFGTLLPPDCVSPTRKRLKELITIENVRKALSVDPGNSFGIWEVPITEESEGLGFGVYPIPSFFNHNCSPNVRKERDGRRLRFVTTRDVALGEEVCISYGHVEAMGLEQRRKELMDGWFFCCQCSQCMTEGGSTSPTRFVPVSLHICPRAHNVLSGLQRLAARCVPGT